ncbi:MAG: ABC transporter permease [Lachnospiraceae bacterium]|nr:ABC transporter permease [Lachnospiraceae bacterium]
MRRYIFQRLILTVVVVLLAAVLIFTIMYFVPGDPARIALGSTATEAEVYEYRVKLGLEDPYLIQLGKFMFNAFLRLDLGTSWSRGVSVMSGLLERLPRTFALGISCVILGLVGLPLGITAAIHRGHWQDRVCSVLSMVFISVPDFWLALMMILLFSVRLNLLPSFGIGSIQHYIMPCIAGAIASIGTLSRQTRSSVLEVINADFVTTARSKGLKEKAVIYKHMLPNALIPVINVIGTSFAKCVGGIIVIEQIFSIPGVGTYMNMAIGSRDYPIIRGCVVILAIYTALLNLLVDIAYAVVDPRIKAQFTAQAKRRKKIHA